MIMSGVHDGPFYIQEPLHKAGLHCTEKTSRLQNVKGARGGKKLYIYIYKLVCTAIFSRLHPLKKKQKILIQAMSRRGHLVML